MINLKNILKTVRNTYNQMGIEELKIQLQQLQDLRQEYNTVLETINNAILFKRAIKINDYMIKIIEKRITILEDNENEEGDSKYQDML